MVHLGVVCRGPARVSTARSSRSCNITVAEARWHAARSSVWVPRSTLPELRHSTCAGMRAPVVREPWRLRPLVRAVVVGNRHGQSVAAIDRRQCEGRVCAAAPKAHLRAVSGASINGALAAAGPGPCRVTWPGAICTRAQEQPSMLSGMDRVCLRATARPLAPSGWASVALGARTACLVAC
jgi:hypothetical protein